MLAVVALTVAAGTAAIIIAVNLFYIYVQGNN